MTTPMRFIRQDVQSMHAYAIQHSDGMVKLDAMENPFSLSPELQAELGKRLGALAINRYPGSHIDNLRNALSRYVDLPQGYGLMLGNGSDELISLLAMVCAVPSAKVLSPEPGFVMYAMSAKLQGLPFVGVPLTADFALDERAMSDCDCATRTRDCLHRLSQQPNSEFVGHAGYPPFDWPSQCLWRFSGDG
jgi:histidinol-phosphate aminotransferase